MNAEITNLRSDKSRLESSVHDIKRQLDSSEKDHRAILGELQKSQLKEESLRAQLHQTTERMQDSREELFMLKQDKEKLFGKVDHLLYENENLRSEVFMMKKIMLEMEKRDMHISSAHNSISDRLMQDLGSKERRRVVDNDIEEIRNRPDARQ